MQWLIPELKDSAFGDASVRQLLDLTTALRAQWPGAFILNPGTHPAPTGEPRPAHDESRACPTIAILSSPPDLVVSDEMAP